MKKHRQKKKPPVPAKHIIQPNMSAKISQPPGTLIHMGEKKTESITLTMIRYNKDTLDEITISDIRPQLKENNFEGVHWLNITGLHNVKMIEDIGAHFGIHPLIQEDILDTWHRSKSQDLEDYIFVVLKKPHLNRETREMKADQLCLILGTDFVLTFLEDEEHIFNAVRERLRKNKGRIRRSGADYLFYTLIDTIVDHHYLLLEFLGEEIESLEELLLEESQPDEFHRLHSVKRDMIFLTKNSWPMRETLSDLLRMDSELISGETKVFLRDVYDHTIQVNETIVTYREMAAGMQDLYLSTVSNKLNEVMKVLTIIATLFIPLTFIVGVYGMNFDFMPELKWRYGYFIIWGIMIACGAAMFYQFKKQKWL